MSEQLGPAGRHWSRERDEDDLLWCHLNYADGKANLLAGEVLDDLYSLLCDLESDMPAGIVILSDKSDSFIFGADIKEFLTLDSDERSLEFLNRGHKVMNKLASMPCPTLSLVHGICLGGGTELSLACDYIIASDDSKTRIGLPEIKLGIHPGYGGTVRSINRMGVLAAMSMMLTGRALPARTARKMGLVDECLPVRQLRAAASDYLLRKPHKKKAGWLYRALAFPFIRPAIATMLRRQVAKKARREHYPAPYALIDLWQKHAGNDERMLREEAITVARLATTDTARNLVRVFFLQEKLKSQGKQSDFKPRHVHVIGGGLMGGDIASWCSIQGYSVSVQDQDAGRLAETYKRAQTSFKKKFKRDRRAIRSANDRMVMDQAGIGIASADIVIEAIFEDLDVKQSLYREIEPLMKPEAILATNTSSIMLEDLSDCLDQPDRLVGLHFFNPVALMPLVEVIHYPGTGERVMQDALAFTRSIGKLPLPTKSSPGFLVNRILMPYLLEAVQMVIEGTQPELIDRAATEFGMPMGPIELADTVGLDVCQYVAGILSEKLGFDLPDGLGEMIDGGRLGKKSGEGFYRYRKGKPVKKKIRSRSGIETVKNRMIYRLINETVACHREGIVDGLESIDAGVIFGTGFAPFRGGPLNYVGETDHKVHLGELQLLEDRFGQRFRPDQGWSALID